MRSSGSQTPTGDREAKERNDLRLRRRKSLLIILAVLLVSTGLVWKQQLVLEQDRLLQQSVLKQMLPGRDPHRTHLFQENHFDPEAYYHAQLKELAPQFGLDGPEMERRLKSQAEKVLKNPTFNYLDDAGQLQAGGQFQPAIELLELAVTKSSKPTQDLSMALGNAFYAAGQLDATVTAYLQALSTIDKASRPLDWIGIAETLAAIYLDQGDYDHSLALLQEVASLNEKSFGNESPNFAAALNNVAQILKTTHRLAEAEPLMRKVLEIDRKSLSSDDPALAVDLNNLAQLLKTTRRLPEAEALTRSALRILFTRSLKNPQAISNLPIIIANYTGILRENGLSQEEIDHQIAALKVEGS